MKLKLVKNCHYFLDLENAEEENEELNEEMTTLNEKIVALELRNKEYEKELKTSEDKLAKTPVVYINDIKPEVTAPYGVTFSPRKLVKSMTTTINTSGEVLQVKDAKIPIIAEKSQGEEEDKNKNEGSSQNAKNYAANSNGEESPTSKDKAKPKVVDTPLISTVPEEENPDKRIPTHESRSSDHSAHRRSCNPTM